MGGGIGMGMQGERKTFFSEARDSDCNFGGGRAAPQATVLGPAGGRARRRRHGGRCNRPFSTVWLSMPSHGHSGYVAFRSVEDPSLLSRSRCSLSLRLGLSRLHGPPGGPLGPGQPSLSTTVTRTHRDAGSAVTVLHSLESVFPGLVSD
jgi:hypothetical protein